MPDSGKAMRSSSSPTPWPGLKPLGPLRPCFRPETSGDQKIAPVLFSAVRELGISRLGKKGRVPVDIFGEFFDIRRRHARGIHRANNAAHAGSGNAVHRDVVLFQPLDHADFGQAQRAPTAESQPDPRTLGCNLGSRGGRGILRGREKGRGQTPQKEESNRDQYRPIRCFHRRS